MDSSLAVQDWAISYIREISVIDPALDYTGYLSWYDKSKNQRLIEIVLTNYDQFIHRLEAAIVDDNSDEINRLIGSMKYGDLAATVSLDEFRNQALRHTVVGDNEFAVGVIL